MEKAVRRYQLIVSQKEKQVKIPTNEESEKDFLSQIDLYTLPYENQADFLYHHRELLAANGIHDFEHCYVSVNYQMNKKEQQLDAAFADRKYLRQFAEGAATYMDEQTGKMFANEVMKQIYNGIVLRQLLSEKVVDSYLTELINDFVYENAKQNEAQIIDNLKRYKTARWFLTAIKTIEKQANRQIFTYPEIIYEADLEKPVVTKDQSSIFDFGVEEPKQLRKKYY